jgi:hypothetical protein
VGGDGRRATGDWRRATGDGRRATGGGRQAAGDGRRATGEAEKHHQSACCALFHPMERTARQHMLAFLPYTRVIGPAAPLPLKKRGGSASAVAFRSASVEPKVKPSKCSSWRLLRKRRKHKPLPSRAPLQGPQLCGPAAAGIPVPGASAPLPLRFLSTEGQPLIFSPWRPDRPSPNSFPRRLLSRGPSFPGPLPQESPWPGLPLRFPIRRGPNPTHVRRDNVLPSGAFPSDGNRAQHDAVRCVSIGGKRA